MERAVLYARVSSEEQVEGYSIDAQKRAFKALCESKDWEPVDEYVDEGKSAHNDNIDNRPAFQQMIDDALAGRFDVLIVHKLDRFSRNLPTTLEYFDKLLKAGVSFVSISEQMDFTTPIGKVQLALLGAFAQYYSDNLSQETKKGWAERRAQGLYCGLLPFGAIKGEDGVPIPHPDTYPGLEMAFELAAQGKTDREVATALNNADYRTAGNQGNKPFSNGTVGGILQNRFYLGELPDNGSWIKAKHHPFISNDIWDQVQEARKHRRKSPVNHPAKGRITSLTGITYCWYCKGRIHVGTSYAGKRRMLCYNRTKGWDCSQKSALLEVYEYQIEHYLETFQIPKEYQDRILQAHQKLQDSGSNVGAKRTKLEARLERLGKLFHWGDLPEQDYLAEKKKIIKQLQGFNPPDNNPEILERLAEFLCCVTEAWKEASQEERNRLARQLFDEIWVKDKQVIAVKPRPELEPFFQLSYEEWMKQFESENSNPLGVASTVRCLSLG